jgi:hypothetical protein
VIDRHRSSLDKIPGEARKQLFKRLHGAPE